MGIESGERHFFRSDCFHFFLPNLADPSVEHHVNQVIFVAQAIFGLLIVIFYLNLACSMETVGEAPVRFRIWNPNVGLFEAPPSKMTSEIDLINLHLLKFQKNQPDPVNHSNWST